MGLILLKVFILLFSNKSIKMKKYDKRYIVKKKYKKKKH